MTEKTLHSDRRKTETPTPQERRNKTPRRTLPQKRRVIQKERRQDMQIIVSASQTDIYLWAISVTLMTLTVVIMLVLAFIHSGGA